MRPPAGAPTASASRSPGPGRRSATCRAPAPHTMTWSPNTARLPLWTRLPAVSPPAVLTRRVQSWSGSKPGAIPAEKPCSSRSSSSPPGARTSGDYEAKLFTPITNGLGAGLDPERALVHAVLELLQRDGNGVSFRALDRGVVVDLEGVEDEETKKILSHLDGIGVEVKAKLAATDFGTANLYVVGEDRDPSRVRHHLTVSACGEACHPDREQALKKALLEFCASRARKPFNHGPLAPIDEISPSGYLERFRDKPLGSEEDRSLEAMLGWLSMSYKELRGLLSAPFSERERVPFTSLPSVPELGGPTDLLQEMTRRLAAEDFEVLYVDVSPEGEGSPDVRAAKVVVPGLEVETMSYGRIGGRNVRRLLARDLGLVGLGSPPKDRPHAKQVLLTKREEAELGGPAWFDYEAADRVVGRLYPLYREPGRHVAALEAERRGLGVGESS